MELWGSESLGRARRAGRPLALLVDAAWNATPSDRLDGWQGALVPAPGAPAYVLVDSDADPAVALRARWILRAFEADENLPFCVLLSAHGGGPSLRPLYALADPLSEEAIEQRDRTLTEWARDPQELETGAEKRRRLLMSSARRGWRSRLSLPEVLEDGLYGVMAALVGRPDGIIQARLEPSAPCAQLMLAAYRQGNGDAGTTGSSALDELADGELRDHLDGGFFHGYRDAARGVPNFARLAVDNAAWLATYSEAAVLFGDAQLAAIAREIGSFLIDRLRDAGSGCFFSGQAADEAYYSWTSQEVTAALPFDRVQVACLHFDIQPSGGLLMDPRRNVLYTARDAEALAPYLGESPEVAAAQILEARAGLLTARAERSAPQFDRTRYVGVNARVASALLIASEVLNEPSWQGPALEALTRIETACGTSGRLVVPHRMDEPIGSDEALLEDHAALGRALLDAHQVTREPRYLEAAERVARELLSLFREPRSGALLDASPASLVSRAFWLEQPLEDTIAPSPFALAVGLLLDLHRETGDPAFNEAAGEALRTGATAALDDPSAAAGYFVALDRFLDGAPPAPSS